MNRIKYTFLLLALLTIGCHDKKHDAARGGMPAPEIEVATPLQQRVTYTYEYPAYLEAEQTVTLVARVSGFLEQMLFTPGQEVKAGQLLFVIEPSPYADRVAAASAAVKSAQAQLDYASASYKKMKEAVKENAVSEIDYIQAESGYYTAQANLQNAQAELNMAQINLSYCYIRAPFNGKITRNLIDRGNYVGGGGQMAELGTVYRDQRMFAYFNMAFSEYVNLPNAGQGGGKGDTILIRDAANPDKQWYGTLEYTAPNVNLQTGTVMARAILNNAKQELLSGMYVKIIVPYKQIDHALLIPENSIGTNQSGRFVYTVGPENTVRLTPVKVGVLETNGLRQIVSGVTETDRYVVNALMGVRPGMPIIPVSATHSKDTDNH